MRKGRLLNTVVLLVILAMVVPTLLAACGAKPTPTAPSPYVAKPSPTPEPTKPPEPTPTPVTVVLKIMDNWGLQADAKGPPLHSIFEDFMAAYPYIKIEEEVFTDVEIPTKVETAFLAKEEPDLIFQNLYGPSLDWIKDGLTVDVTALAKTWGLYDTFKPDALLQWTDDQGRLQGFPLEGFTWPMWYNSAIFKAAGAEIPKTVDELIAASQKIKAAGFEPIVTGGSDWQGQWDFYYFLAAQIPNDELKTLFKQGGWGQSPNVANAVKMFVQMRDGGAFPKDVEGMQFDTMNQKFFEGKAAMMHGGSWSFSEVPEALRKDIVLGGFPLPAGSPHQKPIWVAGYIGKAIWITRNGSEKLDAVEKFVKFFFQSKMIARFVEQAGMTSPLKDTPVDETKLNELFVQSIKISNTVENVEVPDLYVPTKIFEDFLKVANEAFLPGVTAEKIISSLDTVYKGLQ